MEAYEKKFRGNSDFQGVTTNTEIAHKILQHVQTIVEPELRKIQGFLFVYIQNSLYNAQGLKFFDRAEVLSAIKTIKLNRTFDDIITKLIEDNYK